MLFDPAPTADLVVDLFCDVSDVLFGRILYLASAAGNLFCWDGRGRSSIRGPGVVNWRRQDSRERDWGNAGIFISGF